MVGCLSFTRIWICLSFGRCTDIRCYWLSLSRCWMLIIIRCGFSFMLNRTWRYLFCSFIAMKFGFWLLLYSNKLYNLIVLNWKEMENWDLVSSLGRVIYVFFDLNVIVFLRIGVFELNWVVIFRFGSELVLVSWIIFLLLK